MLFIGNNMSCVCATICRIDDEMLNVIIARWTGRRRHCCVRNHTSWFRYSCACVLPHSNALHSNDGGRTAVCSVNSRLPNVPASFCAISSDARRRRTVTLRLWRVAPALFNDFSKLMVVAFQFTKCIIITNVPSLVTCQCCFIGGCVQYSFKLQMLMAERNNNTQVFCIYVLCTFLF